jgi:hypothetical protein
MEWLDLKTGPRLHILARAQEAIILHNARRIMEWLASQDRATPFLP